MKKAVIVILAVFVTITSVFLAHDMIKEHQSFRDSIAECAIGGGIASVLILGIGFIALRRKK